MTSDGHLAVDSHVFDLGGTTHNALLRLRSGVPAESSGGSDDASNGNGSLMRVLALVLWHRGSDESLVAIAHRQSLPTHAHPRSQVACAFYSLIARALLHEVPDAIGWAKRRLRGIYQTRVAAGLAGIRYGLGAIPDRWRKSLRGRDIYQPLLQRLVERER
jgi:ADP-ribosyl-[dinitrogen reductase] hydrolase